MKVTANTNPNIENTIIINADLDLSTLRIPTLFKMIREVGNVDEMDMLKTFNVGVGMVLVIDPKDLELVISHLSKHNLDGYQIGIISTGEKRVNYLNQVEW